MPEFKRTPEELERVASKHWPADIMAKETNASIIPLLIETQEEFIGVLHLFDMKPDSWKEAFHNNSKLKPNVFLKHLMVLSDVGGEPLKRLGKEFRRIFPTDTMHYIWRENEYQYDFKAIPQSKTLDNKALGVDGKQLSVGRNLTGLIEDVAMFLLHGATAIGVAGVNPDSGTGADLVPAIVREKCVLGSMIGQKDALTDFVKQRYIWVSRITGGATSNALGQLMQDYVVNTLTQALPGWKVARNGKIPGISNNAGRTDTSFDIVVQSPAGKYTAIEVCFQFTTNSVIERKAGQAQERTNLLHHAGHSITYVIDGAGNFERRSALQTLCAFSDCTVAVKKSEMAVLVEFLKQSF